MMIDNKNFYLLWGDALQSDNRDRYVSEWSTSSIWGLPEELSDDDLLGAADKLGQIWDIAHMSVKGICQAAGLTQAALAQRFCIPLRTVEDWSRGARKCPDYIRLMMAEALGIITRG